MRIAPLLLLLTGCGVWPRPENVVVDPPGVLVGAVIRLDVQSDAGRSNTGTGFAAHIGNQAVILTCRHLFSRRGGLKRDLTPEEWPRAVREVGIMDRFTMDMMGEAEIVPLPATVGNVALLKPTKPAKLQPFRVNNVPIDRETRVWLIARLKGENWNTFRATVVSTPEATDLEYRFQLDPNLHGADGAPIVTDDGAVVGIHIGSDDIDGYRHGFAVPTWRFVRAVEAAIR